MGINKKSLEEQHKRRMRQAELKALERKYRDEEREVLTGGKRKFPTSKLLTIYLFVVLNVVLIYAMWAMIAMRDISSLGLLITDVAGQVLTLAVYMLKSAKENSEKGITYELAVMEKQHEYAEQDFNYQKHNDDEDNGAVG